MDRNTELGEFLRSRRAAVSPDAGWAGRGPRRVLGLRREELAQLAGVSADYYTRLEQGRPVNPSDSVLDALADALRLDPAERAHLYDLVRPRPARRRVSSTVQRVRPGLYKMMETLDLQPGFILGRRMDVLASNRLARALLTDFNALPARERNMLRWILLDPAARELYHDWASIAAEMVGVLRLDAGRYPDDPRTTELVGELAMKSDHFRTWWAQHTIHERTHGHKRFHHPVVGDLDIDYEALTMPGDPDQTLFIYTASDTKSEQALRLLASWTAPNTPADQPTPAK